MSVGIYYKARGIPWRLAYTHPNVCFVGLSFHRLDTNQQRATYASLAQAFTTDIEGFVLRGERVPRRPDRQLYLTGEQAERLGRMVLAQYYERAEQPPVRITLHKTTRFTTEEREGFRAAFREVPVVELVTLALSGFRLLPRQEYPPRRGTLCTVNGHKHFLYTTGFYRDWGTYPGPHIPTPLELVIDGDEESDLRRIAEETLGLTKMNYNSASIGGRDPITLHMASDVGPIMAEVPEEATPELSYRYYM